MSSLAKEFYQDPTINTPYDLDAYKTGVGFKRTNWKQLCQTTSPLTLTEYPLAKNHTINHCSSLMASKFCKKHIQICPKCYEQPYSLFRKFISAPYTRYSPIKQKKAKKTKTMEVQTENIQPPVVIGPSRQRIPQNNMVYRQQIYQPQPQPQVVYRQQPLYYQQPVSYNRIIEQKPQNFQVPQRVIVNHLSNTSLMQPLSQVTVPPPPAAPIPAKVQPRTSIMNRIVNQQRKSNESKQSESIKDNLEHEQSQNSIGRVDSVEIVSKEIRKKPKGIRFVASNQKIQDSQSKQQTQGNQIVKPYYQYSENQEYVAKNITDSQTYEEQITQSIQQRQESTTMTMQMSKTQKQKTTNKFSGQTAIEEDASGEDLRSDASEHD